MVTTVRGAFGEFTAPRTSTPRAPAPRPSALSIPRLDRQHRLGRPRRPPGPADFFDVENHPTITFTSTTVERSGDDWAITGDLVIKGRLEVPVTIDLSPPAPPPTLRQPARRLRGQHPINRKDWEPDLDAALETGGVLVSEKIKLEFDISAIKNV